MTDITEQLSHRQQFNFKAVNPKFGTDYNFYSSLKVNYCHIVFGVYSKFMVISPSKGRKFMVIALGNLEVLTKS